MALLPRDRPALGKFGEAVAAHFLERRGARVLARNVAAAAGEIDLIVSCGGELAAVEVRTARRADVAPELISLRKERQMRRVAARLEPPVFRIDLVVVLVGREGVRVRWHPRM